MIFRTEVNPRPFPFQINHQDKILLMGSCFTQNIGAKLSNHGFRIMENPYGITFNPLSLSQQLTEIVKRKEYIKEDLEEMGEYFISFQHHSSFNRPQKYEMLVDINTSINDTHSFLKEAKVLIISIGTAWVWGHKNKNKIVNNCHKVPSTEFEQVLTKPEFIIQEFAEALAQLNQINPDLQVIFTISPVRHWKSGAMKNSRSKSVLISSIHEIVDAHENCHYFPSFEIMMDDLRDYRFYKDDLLHPSEKAIEYIWNKFEQAFFNEKTMRANKAAFKVKSMIQHRPFNPESQEYEKFKKKLDEKKVQLDKEFGIVIS